jgi:hypothetical protein
MMWVPTARLPQPKHLAIILDRACWSLVVSQALALVSSTRDRILHRVEGNEVQPIRVPGPRKSRFPHTATRDTLALLLQLPAVCALTITGISSVSTAASSVRAGTSNSASGSCHLPGEPADEKSFVDGEVSGIKFVAPSLQHGRLLLGGIIGEGRERRTQLVVTVNVRKRSDIDSATGEQHQPLMNVLGSCLVFHTVRHGWSGR